MPFTDWSDESEALLSPALAAGGTGSSNWLWNVRMGPFLSDLKRVPSCSLAEFLPHWKCGLFR